MKFPSVQAVSNCAFVPDIPTIEVWSPVLEPERVVIPSLERIVVPVSSPEFVPLVFPITVSCESVTYLLFSESGISPVVVPGAR
jgi:hypothetical protein